MNPLNTTDCACAKGSNCSKNHGATQKKQHISSALRLFLSVEAVAIWYAIYRQLEPLSHFLAYGVLLPSHCQKWLFYERS